MKPGFDIFRWLKVVMLGCLLGLGVGLLGMLPRFIDLRARTLQPAFRLSEDRNQRALIRVVDSQLSALRRGDYPGAFRYADASFHAGMSPQNFEKMLKKGYANLLQSKAATYGMILDNGEEALVNVTISDPAGRTAHYQYLLRREWAGWRISGVMRVRPEGTTV